MPTVFTRILNGEIPGTFVWRDERCAAFMSINPMAHGHVLVIPVAEIDHWVDLDPDDSAHLFAVAHHIASAQRAAFAPERVGLIIAGYEVPHTHVHVIPTNDMGQLSFANAAMSVERSSLESAAATIRHALRAAGHDTEVVG
jgi:histidine triad (HIT) family protein